MPDSPLQSMSATPAPVNLHERSVVLGESLFLRLMACYMGTGPNFHGQLISDPQPPTSSPDPTPLETPPHSLGIQAVPPVGGRLIPRGVGHREPMTRSGSPTFPPFDPTPKDPHNGS